MGKKIFKKLPSGIIPIIVLEFILVSLVFSQYQARKKLSTVVFNMLMTIWVLLFIGGTGFKEFWESAGFDFDRSWILLILGVGAGFLAGEIMYLFSSQSGMLAAGILPFPYVQASLNLSKYFSLATLNTLWIGIGEEILSFLFLASWSNLLSNKLNLGFWPSISIGTVLGRVNWAVLHFKAYSGMGIAPYVAAVFLGVVFTFCGWAIDLLGNLLRNISLKPRKVEYLIVPGIIAHFIYDLSVMSALSGRVLFLARMGLALIGLG